MVSNGNKQRRGLVPLAAWQRDVDHLFDQFFKAAPRQLVPGWFAPLTAWEDEGTIHLELEVPGVKREDLDVSFHEGHLVLSGERKSPEGERKEHIAERRYGRFERVITVPDTVNPDSVEANLADGVLHVVLHKRPEEQPRKIEIKG